MFYSINGSFNNIIEHLSEDATSSINDVNLEDLSIEELESKLLESNNKLKDLDSELNTLGLKEIVLKSINNYENLEIKDMIGFFINNNLYDKVDGIITALNNILETKNSEIENLNSKVTELINYKSKVDNLQIFYRDSVILGKNKVLELEYLTEKLSTVQQINVNSLRKKDKSEIKYYPSSYVYDKCESNYDNDPPVTAKIMKNKKGKFVLAHGIDEDGKLGLLINNSGDLVLEGAPYIDINGFKLEFIDDKLRIVTKLGNGISIGKGSIDLFAGAVGKKNYFCIDDKTDKDNCLDKNKIRMIQTINEIL